MTRPYKIGFTVFVFVLWLFGACDNPVSYSPFEANVAQALRHTTQKNLDKISKIDTIDNPPFKVALISDVHYHYSELRDAIAHINKKNDIAFIIVTGDITENGLQKEFELFHHVMASANKPYLTVIGNHDHLSNGGKVYQQIFGPLNYSFTFHNVKFVMWDNVLWESNKTPDWEWFNDSLGKIKDGEHNVPYHHIIPVSHIPPFDSQLSPRADAFHALLRDSKVKLSVHGHRHTYFSDELFGDGINYMTVGSPQYRGYAQLTVTPDEVVVTKIEY